MNISGPSLTGQLCWGALKSAWIALFTSHNTMLVPCLLHIASRRSFYCVSTIKQSCILVWLWLKKTYCIWKPCRSRETLIPQLLQAITATQWLYKPAEQRDRNVHSKTTGIERRWMRRCSSVVNLQSVQLNISALCAPPDTCWHDSSLDFLLVEDDALLMIPHQRVSTERWEGDFQGLTYLFVCLFLNTGGL